jgi:adenylosuccinate lyase
VIAWRSLGRGLAKVSASPARIAADIGDAWEVLGEAVQTVLRAHGVPGGYERLKDFTRGQEIDSASLAEFIDSLPLPASEKARLRQLTPSEYVGLAAQLARGLQ